jgi:hypothetical protein
LLTLSITHIFLYHIAILRIGAEKGRKHAVINILTLTGH